MDRSVPEVPALAWILEPTIVSLSVDERGLLDGKVTSGALLRDTGRIPVNVPHACGRYGFAFAIAKISHVFF